MYKHWLAAAAKDVYCTNSDDNQCTPRILHVVTLKSSRHVSRPDQARYHYALTVSSLGSDWQAYTAPVLIEKLQASKGAHDDGE